MDIRPLTVADAAAYADIRREMLLDAPWAFAASPGDRSAEATWIADRLCEPGQVIIGAFEGDGRTVSVAGAHLPHHAKMAHRAHIWGVYTRPAFRGRGLSTGVLSALLDHVGAWPGVTSAGLSVSIRSPKARRVYERMGFRAWGTEPGAIVLDGEAVDEVHMVVTLPGSGR